MNNSRRKFIKQSGVFYLFYLPQTFSNLTSPFTSEVKINQINLFLINVNKNATSVMGWKNRQHVMINIKGGDHIGWGETKVSSNKPNFDISAWSKEFKKLKE